MLNELLELKENESLEELCERFGRFLGLDAPAPKPVLLHAINDSDYATHLIVSRDTPEFLHALFGAVQSEPEQPDRTLSHDAGAMPPPSVTARSPHTKQTDADLVKHAASALLRWGKAGFSIVDDATLKRREEACLICPNLGAPGSMLQKLVSAGTVREQVGQRARDRVCKLCGCNIAKKIKLPTEYCPDRHPTETGLTRWGEPLHKNENA